MPEYIIHPIPCEICGVRLVAGDFIREGDCTDDPSSGEWRKAPHYLIGEKIRKGSRLRWVRPAEIFEHSSPPAIYGKKLVVGDIVEEGDERANPYTGEWEKVPFSDIDYVIKKKDLDYGIIFVRLAVKKK